MQSGEGRGDGLLEFHHRELCGMLDSTDQRFQTEEEKLTQRHKICTRQGHSGTRVGQEGLRSSASSLCVAILQAAQSVHLSVLP